MALQNPYTPSPSPFSLDERTSRGGMQRAAAFKALQDQMYGDPLAQQRSNIQSHGSIENPDQYGQRMARQDAAELSNPGSARGMLRSQDMGHEMGMATGPAQISADAQRDSARTAADSRLELADLEGMYGADEAEMDAAQAQQDAQADAMKQWAGALTGNTVLERPALLHLQEMMRKQYPGAPFLEPELPEEEEETNLPWHAGFTR